jgi:hypothetical protein
MKTTLLGDIGVARVIADLTERGYIVSIPLRTDCRYDLIVDRGGTPERVQVKAVRSNGEMIEVKCRSTSSWGQRTRSTHSYTTEDVDWVATYDHTTGVIVYVPARELNATAVHLRLSPARNGQAMGIRYASDFQAI